MHGRDKRQNVFPPIDASQRGKATAHACPVGFQRAQAFGGALMLVACPMLAIGATRSGTLVLFSGIAVVAIARFLNVMRAHAPS